MSAVIGSDIWPRLEKILGLEGVVNPVNVFFDFRCGEIALVRIECLADGAQVDNLLDLIADLHAKGAAAVKTSILPPVVRVPSPARSAVGSSCTFVVIDDPVAVIGDRAIDSV